MLISDEHHRIQLLQIFHVVINEEMKKCPEFGSYNWQIYC